MTLGLRSTSKPLPSRAGGVWRFDGETVSSLAQWDVGPKVILTPSQSTRLVALDLPAKSARDRVLALPFAFEDILAEPLDASAFAVGVALAPSRYLVAATNKTVLDRWIARLDALGLPDALLTPEALMLPVPPTGKWSLAVLGSQAIVRTEDGGGFATRHAQIGLAWEAANRPGIVLFDAADTSLPIESQEPLAPHLAMLSKPSIDLRQGVLREALPIRRRLGQLAAIGLMALLAHGAVAAAEGFQLHRLAKLRHAQALASLRTTSPQISDNADLIGELDALALPQAASGFTPLLSRTAGVLGQLPSPLRLRGLAFDARDASLTLSIETEGLGQLHRINSALLKAGLNARIAGARYQDGVAVGDVVVEEPTP